MVKKLANKLPVLYVCLLVLILIGFGYIRYQINHAQPIMIQQAPGDDLSLRPISFDLEISKGWLESYGLRANQYDATFYNNNNYPLIDWEVKLQLPADAQINDSWSCDFSIDDQGVATFKGLDYNVDVPAGEAVTFGFILFSPQTEEIETFKISATPVYRVTHFALFYVLCVLSLVWLIAVFSTLSVRIMSVYYERRRARDQQIIIQSIKTFTNFIDAKDPYTKGHSSRVAQYARLIASHMGYSKEELDNIYYIALLHDVGKMGIPDNILNKPAKLTPEERKVIETHTTNGAEMLKDFSTIPDIISGALYHHERYDGTGYPRGLKAEDIPMIARIICVADSYDAMNSVRCYRGALSKEEIMNELDRCSGTQFDPEIAAIMLDLMMNNKADIV